MGIDEEQVKIDEKTIIKSNTPQTIEPVNKILQTITPEVIDDHPKVNSTTDERKVLVNTAIKSSEIMKDFPEIKMAPNASFSKLAPFAVVGAIGIVTGAGLVTYPLLTIGIGILFAGRFMMEICVYPSLGRKSLFPEYAWQIPFIKRNFGIKED